MKFSAKGEYGIRAILDVALYGKDNPVQVKEIAKRQFIPERFLEQVMASLKKAGLVRSLRGAQGGYVLAKPSADISLADVIQAIEGLIAPMECVSDEIPNCCDQSELCVIRDVWKNVQTSIVDALDSITVEDICRKKKLKDKSIKYMYHI